MWVDKYKPVSIRDLVGNGRQIQKLEEFLQTWEFGQEMKAVLLSGPPGIGKTSSAHVVCRASGYDIVELNASDVRSQKIVHEKLCDAVHNKSIIASWSRAKTEPRGKLVLIMDEVDGMSSGDRGGMAELLNLIKDTKIPIICICNDAGSQKLRTLKSKCLHLVFAPPTGIQLAPRVQQICKLEGLSVDRQTVLKVAEVSRGDVRQILHLLQSWLRSPGAMLLNTEKDISLGPLEVVPRFFQEPNKNNKNWVDERTEFFFADYSFMPLFIFDQYLNVTPNIQDELQVLEAFSEAADSISEAQVIDHHIRETQDYNMLTEEAVLSCIKPSYLVRGRIGRPVFFPSWLGKNSSQTKNTHLLSELRSHMSSTISASHTALACDYIAPLRSAITRPLVCKGNDGINDIISTMEHYNLTKEDRETVMELCNFGSFDPKSITTKLKSAFTRAFNKHKPSGKCRKTTTEEKDQNNNEDEDAFIKT